MKTEEFNYDEAVKRLEDLVSLAENPEINLDNMESYINEAGELIKKCREYLREAKKKVDEIEF